MLLKSLDLTTALRPELLPGENLLFVQDAIGLYEGKFKIPSHQHGHGYLTTHRICYVDNAEPRANSSAIDLKEVDRYEFYAGFLKSSAKITLFPKPPKRTLNYSSSQHLTSSSTSGQGARQGGSLSSSPRNSINRPLRSQVETPALSQDSTWICPICSFSNPVPTNFDPTTANAQTPIPPCLACGIKPPLVHVLKAAITSRSSSTYSAGGDQPQRAPRPRHGGSAREGDGDEESQSRNVGDPSNPEGSSVVCPRCTFHNHPSLLACELCGASLISPGQPRPSSGRHDEIRAESPGPTLQLMKSTHDEVLECIKLSFRGGGEKIFYERLKVAMVQRRWLLQTAPPIAQPQVADVKTGKYVDQAALETRSKVGGGIAGLERRGNVFRQNNQLVIGNAFEDLEALMSSAKEIIALAEDFASRSSDATPEASAILSESATALGMTATKDMLGSRSSSDTLYVSELARTLAEYLTDDQRGVLKREGGIMSLVDLWAVFNRARNGVELVSPAEFEKAARQWERLGLPVRLREFKNGLLVVQRHDWTDDKIVAQLLAWFQTLHSPVHDTAWDAATFGVGATSMEVAAYFGWSVGVATEELEMAEERGVLCREEGVEGVKFWENHFGEETE